MSLKGKQLVLSFFFLLFFVKIEMVGQVINNSGKFEEGNVERKSSFNIEEIKVRWKKAALENCTGVPCVSTIAPGVPTGVVATAGNASASVAFVAPSNTGGSAITGYTVTSSPGSIPAMGTTSPINVTGLTNGTPYTFNIVETNAVGNSLASAASPSVTPAPSFTCGTSTISDIDGNTYNTVLIGMQCWTKENLKVTKYNDGISIPDKTADAGWGGLTVGARTNYTTGSTSYIATYGYLYNWYAVKGIDIMGSTSFKNICPTGWHVPSNGEWHTLVISIDPMANTTVTGDISSTAGGKMKSTTGWNPSVGIMADNSSGFTALPGGSRDNTTSSYDIGDYATWWSITDVPPTPSANAYIFYISYSANKIAWSNDGKVYGFSVRCLKD